MNGLNSHEIEYRINNDMVNNKIIKNSRSLKKYYYLIFLLYLI